MAHLSFTNKGTGASGGNLLEIACFLTGGTEPIVPKSGHAVCVLTLPSWSLSPLLVAPSFSWFEFWPCYLLCDLDLFLLPSLTIDVLSYKKRLTTSEDKWEKEVVDSISCPGWLSLPPALLWPVPLSQLLSACLLVWTNDSKLHFFVHLHIFSLIT